MDYANIVVYAHNIISSNGRSNNSHFIMSATLFLWLSGFPFMFLGKFRLLQSIHSHL